MFSRSRPTLFASPRRGIALLVTIILLSFLVLIMVALSAIVRVETKIESNKDTLAQARQNALTGLNIALGKLQETAGPDQRVTARADIFEDNNAEIDANRHYQMNLTGVWDTTNAGAPPTLITWLVNGNEDLEGDRPNIRPDAHPSAGLQRNSNENLLIPTASDDNVPAGEPGDNPSTAPLFNDNEPPAIRISPVNLGIGSNAPEFNFGDGHVYLVANGSVDVTKDRPNGPLLGESYKHAAEERVIVRKTPIIVDGAKLPGKAAGSDVTIGHYAYWVSDAGIKASLAGGNRVPDIDYEETGGGISDYSSTAADADDQGYMNRRWLSILQLQGSRLDMVLRPELTTAGDYLDDIFVINNAPTYLGLNQNNVDRRAIYGVIEHPLTREARLNLFFGGRIDNLLHEGAFTAPVLADVQPVPTATNSVNDFKTVINTRLKQLYHDVTPQNYSVLTNMLTGGLRTDLSPAAGMAARPANERAGVDKFANELLRPTAGPMLSLPPVISAEGLLQRTLTMPAPGTQIATLGETAYPISPVISEFRLNATLDLDPATGAVTVSFDARVELWNPYNATLDVPAANDLFIELALTDTAGPVITRVSSQPPSAVLDFSMQRTLAGITPFPLTTAAFSMEPGEIIEQTFTIPTRNALTPANVQLAYPSLPTSLVIDSYAGATLTVRLQENDGAAFSTLSEFTDVAFTEIAGTANAFNILYQFKLIDWVNGTNGDSWRTFDPRGPILGGANLVVEALNSTAGFSNANDVYDNAREVILFDVPRQEIISVGSLRHVSFPGQPLYAVGALGNNQANVMFEDVYFSGVPRDTNVLGWTPLSGKPLANTATVIVDPAPSASTSELELWNGIAGTEMDGLTSAKSAQYILVRDTLNVNSTSDVAWRSLLAGSLPTTSDPTALGDVGTDFNSEAKNQDYVWRRNDANYPGTTHPQAREFFDIWSNWRFYDGANVDTVPIRNAFFRYPHTATMGDYATLRNALQGASAATRTMGAREDAAFKTGIRELTREQVAELAWWVTYRIKNPAGGQTRPFRSLTQFINEGVLDYAIGRVGSGDPNTPVQWTANPNPPINNPGTPVPAESLPSGSPAFLTQGDILEMIGHRLFARSDTFTIRAYGDVNDPDALGAGRPKVLARAWVEATVQRMPMKHPTADEPDDNVTRTNTGGSEVGNFGRQFRIINLRWLRPEEI